MLSLATDVYKKINYSESREGKNVLLGGGKCVVDVWFGQREGCGGIHTCGVHI